MIDWEDEPYFMLYLGHNETVFPLLQALDNLQPLMVDPAAAVFFEFYTENSTNYVNLILRDGTNEQTLMLPCSTD